MNGQQLYLKPEEAKFLSMSVVNLLDQLKESATNQNVNWLPTVRREMKEMLDAGTALSIKLKKMGFDMRELPPYIDGEETNYLTKES